VYATHLRNESNRLVQSVNEAIDVAQAAGVRLQFSHHKSMGESNWGRTAETLQIIDAARRRGLAVNQDVYPYTVSSTTMTALLPPQFHEGGADAIMLRLGDEEQIARLRDLLGTEDGWDNKVAASGWHAIRVASTRSHTFEGRYMSDIAVELDTDPVSAMVDLLVSEQLAVTMTVDAMSERDVERVLRDGHTMIGSDGLPPGLGGKPHPRISGTFPRVLEQYVRKSGLLSLEEAVRRMTSLPASAFSIPERGLLAPGAIADVVAFDAANVEDRATYDDPLQPPLGIAWVLLAGEIAVQDGRYVGVRMGRRIRPLAH
jgi:N-acyl-D-aspartate/D-glutamate deacylase